MIKQTKMNPETVTENAESADLLQEHDLSMEGYDKPVKKARNILFAIAALQLIGGIFIGIQDDGTARIITISILVAISLVFFILGLWTKQKPYTAIVTGLIIYSALLTGDAIFDLSTLIQGILLKIFVYSLLISALSNAREVQRWKDSLKQS